jgi:enoyl-CoA hydratase/carnithine racemase
MDPDVLSVTTSERITTLELARPQVHNAITLTMARRLHAAIGTAAHDARCDALVITGAGAAFCSGLDLREQAGQSDEDHRELLELMYQRIPGAMMAAPKPVIAAVNGAARGGGCTIAFACDLLVAASSATFGLPEIHVGLLPGYHLNHLPGILGKARAFELAFGGEPVSATEAERLGLANRVVPEEDWAGGVRDFVLAFADLPRAALAEGKHYLYESSGAHRGGAEAVDLLMRLRRALRDDAGDAAQPKTRTS